MKTLKEYVSESYVDDALNDKKTKRHVYKWMPFIKDFITANIDDILDEWGWGDAYMKCIEHMSKSYSPGIGGIGTRNWPVIKNSVLPKWLDEWLVKEKLK